MSHEKPPTAPEPGRVARRAIILAAITCRARLDNQGAEGRAVVTRLRAWLRGVDLGDELHPSEAALMRTPFGRIPPDRRAYATWNAEALAVLAWALGQWKLPLHDELIDAIDVAYSVGLFDDDAAPRIASATLRPLEERRALREVLYALDVRLTGLHRDRSRRNIAHHFEPSWWTTLGIVAPLGADGDLLIDGRPVVEAAPEREEQCWAATKERHRASIWLVGESAVYAETNADT